MKHVYSNEEAEQLKTKYDGKFIQYVKKYQTISNLINNELYGWIKIDISPIDDIDKERKLVTSYILSPGDAGLDYLDSFDDINKVFTIEDLIIHKLSHQNVWTPKFNTYEKEL